MGDNVQRMRWMVHPGLIIDLEVSTMKITCPDCGIKIIIYDDGSKIYIECPHCGYIGEFEE